MKTVTITFVLVLCSLWACNDKPPEAPQRSRVEAVESSRPDTPVQSWCDVHLAEDKAVALSLPPALPVKAGGKKPLQGPNRWIWLNLWATWCKPCIREMPLVLRFGDKLRDDGIALDNWFLSLDEERDVLADYLRGRPELAGDNSLLAMDPDNVQEWLKTLGLPADTTIPVNLLVGPGGKVRCLRTGSIGEGDYARILSVLKQL